MTISHRYRTDRAKLALELTMRDALAGMEELASMDVFGFAADCMEILGIEPPHPDARKATAVELPRAAAAILTFPEKRRRAV